MKPENGKTESVNEHQYKDNKNVEGFKNTFCKKKPQNTKVKTQSDMKAWKRFCLQQHKNSELCDIPADGAEFAVVQIF